MGDLSALGAQDGEERHLGLTLLVPPEAVILVDRRIKRSAMNFFVSIRNQYYRDEPGSLNDFLQRWQNFLQICFLFVSLILDEISHIEGDFLFGFGRPFLQRKAARIEVLVIGPNTYGIPAPELPSHAGTNQVCDRFLNSCGP